MIRIFYVRFNGRSEKNYSLSFFYAIDTLWKMAENRKE